MEGQPLPPACQQVVGESGCLNFSIRLILWHALACTEHCFYPFRPFNLLPCYIYIPWQCQVALRKGLARLSSALARLWLCSRPFPPDALPWSKLMDMPAGKRTGIQVCTLRSEPYSVISPWYVVHGKMATKRMGEGKACVSGLETPCGCQQSFYRCFTLLCTRGFYSE